MIKIDRAYLEQVGLQRLPRDEVNPLLKYVYDTLETRVGITLVDRMTTRQRRDFERYFEAKDDEGAFQWLTANFPDYKEVVAREFELLTAELQQAAPTILSLVGMA